MDARERVELTAGSAVPGRPPAGAAGRPYRDRGGRRGRDRVHGPGRVQDRGGAARGTDRVGSAPEVIASLRRDADEVVCLHTPKMFAAIGQWYAEFTQTRDEEVVALLNRAAAPIGRQRRGGGSG